MLNIDIENFEIHTTNMKINNKNQDVICISFEADEVPSSINQYYDVEKVNFSRSSLSIHFTDGIKDNNILVNLKQNSLDEETFEMLKKYQQIVIYGSEEKTINNGFSFLSPLINIEPVKTLKKGLKPF